MRVALAHPNDALGATARSGSLSAVLLGDALPASPARGDFLRIAGVPWRVEDAARDPLGLSWRLTLAPA